MELLLEGGNFRKKKIAPGMDSRAVFDWTQGRSVSCSY